MTCCELCVSAQQGWSVQASGHRPHPGQGWGWWRWHPNIIWLKSRTMHKALEGWQGSDDDGDIVRNWCPPKYPTNHGAVECLALQIQSLGFHKGNVIWHITDVRWKGHYAKWIHRQSGVCDARGTTSHTRSCAHDGGGVGLTIKEDVKRGMFPLLSLTGVGIKCIWSAQLTLYRGPAAALARAHMHTCCHHSFLYLSL
jgi:hypothetical protein